MSPERREVRPDLTIPEMPRREHTPELIKWFVKEKNPQLIKSRDRFFEILRKRDVKDEDSRFLLGITALAAWIHRNDVRLTGEPYIVHTIDVAANAIAHPAITKEEIRRVGAGLLLHDAIEDNPHVTKQALIPHVGRAVANDIDNYYSKKRAKDLAEGLPTEISPEDFLAKFLKGRFHLKLGKVADRIENMKKMPPVEKNPSRVSKMYDRYFRKETEAMVEIIKSMGRSASGRVYEEYRKVHNKNKPPDVPELPPLDETDK